MDFKPHLITKDSCTLGWKRPVSDGGSHVTAYVLEVNEGEDKWKQLIKSKTPTHSVTDLEEGKEYTYRVKAVNESGEGPPTDIVVLAKDQIGKCYNFSFFHHN